MKNISNTLLASNSTKSLKTYISKTISLLENFTNQRLIIHGSVLHAQLLRLGLSSQKHIAVKLLTMYLNSRKSQEIEQMMKEFNGFNLVAHNCLINANLNWGNVSEARHLFDGMPERNAVSWTALISGLLRYGRVDEAMSYFDKNPFQDLFLWTAMISGLVRNGLSYEAMEVFVKMLKTRVVPNDVTFTAVVRACGELGDFGLGMSVLGLIVKVGFEDNLSVSNSLVSFNVRLGNFNFAKRIFDRMGERDVVSWTAILDMYVEMGDLTEARRVFDQMPERNDVSWSMMIARYTQTGYLDEAVKLFLEMVNSGFKPNTSCYSSVISALASLNALQEGKNIHGSVVKIGMERDVYISSSLVDLYCKCGNTRDGQLIFDLILEKNVVSWNSMVVGYSLNGQLEEAKEVFNQIPNKNIISWNSLIVGYVEAEDFDGALEVFDEMILLGEWPNKSTFSSVLKACAGLVSLARGEYMHTKVVKLGFQCDIFMGTALVDLYAKCGNIEGSRKIFCRMPTKNEIAWTAMIQGLAENGFAKESLALFDKMEKTSTVKPNELILLSVLFACSHCSLVDKGLSYFNAMEKVYGIKPSTRHYTSVVDMLSRAGRVSEAEEFIMKMPIEPDVNAWAALLSGCKIYGDERRAARVARKVLEESETKSGAYVLLSNVYASSGRWIDVLSTRKMMKEKGVKKSGGCSWIEVKNRVHLFFSQDDSHAQFAEIIDVLQLVYSSLPL